MITDPETATAREELSQMIQQRLGRPLPLDKFEGLFMLQTELRLAQGQLATELDTTATTPEGYLERLNNLMLSFTNGARNLLGDKQFIEIFGDAGLNPEGMIDRQNFLASYGRSFPGPTA